VNSIRISSVDVEILVFLNFYSFSNNSEKKGRKRGTNTERVRETERVRQREGERDRESEAERG
jgi:hypothetical protein